MVKEIERRGEVVGIEAKSAVLAGLGLAGRLEEALALYEALIREGAYPEAYAAGILLVSFLIEMGQIDTFIRSMYESLVLNKYLFGRLLLGRLGIWIAC